MYTGHCGDADHEYPMNLSHFKKIGEFDASIVLEELKNNPDLWDKNTLRTTHENTAHKDVSDIWLWFPDLGNHLSNMYGVMDDLSVIPYPALYRLPQASSIVNKIFDLVNGVEIGKSIITALHPQGHITPHTDDGKSSEYFERYHAVIQSEEGNTFKCGNEETHMKSGEIWWFDNRVTHELLNKSNQDRIHLVCDIK